MHELATATGFEMPTGRRNPVGRGRVDLDITQGLTVKRTADHLAGQGKRGKNGALGDPVTLMAQSNDFMLAHAPGFNPSWARDKG